VSEPYDVHITPQAPDEDREAILAAVRETLRREADLARPQTWRISGWTAQRAGLTDFGRWVPDHRRWALSSRIPLGGRTFNGLSGRGDAK
jgi:hypothetical protein